MVSGVPTAGTSTGLWRITPGPEMIGLTKNYRSTKTILKAACQIIDSHRTRRNEERLYSEIEGDRTLSIIKAASETAEAVAIGKTIERLVGGTGFHSIDFGHIEPRQRYGPKKFYRFCHPLQNKRAGKEHSSGSDGSRYSLPACAPGNLDGS